MGKHVEENCATYDIEVTLFVQKQVPGSPFRPKKEALFWPKHFLNGGIDVNPFDKIA